MRTEPTLTMLDLELSESLLLGKQHAFSTIKLTRLLTSTMAKNRSGLHS